MTVEQVAATLQIVQHLKTFFIKKPVIICARVNLKKLFLWHTNYLYFFGIVYLLVSKKEYSTQLQ